jgi:hypothetical protein
MNLRTPSAAKTSFLSQFGDFSFLKKWAFATEYSLCRKLAPLLRTFHPKKRLADTWELQAKRLHGTFLL